MTNNYRAAFKSFLNQGLSLHFGQNRSEIIIKCNKPQPCSYSQSQRGLYLNISIHDNKKYEKKIMSLQNHLKQLFFEIVELQKYPNASINVQIFILQECSTPLSKDNQKVNKIEQEQSEEKNNLQRETIVNDIKSCIVNGLWLILLKLGINMKKSIWCYETANTGNNSHSSQIVLENQLPSEPIPLANKQNNLEIYDINQRQTLIEGEMALQDHERRNELTKRVDQQIMKYKQFVHDLMQRLS